MDAQSPAQQAEGQRLSSERPQRYSASPATTTADVNQKRFSSGFSSSQSPPPITTSTYNSAAPRFPEQSLNETLDLRLKISDLKQELTNLAISNDEFRSESRAQVLRLSRQLSAAERAAKEAKDAAAASRDENRSLRRELAETKDALAAKFTESQEHAREAEALRKKIAARGSGVSAARAAPDASATRSQISSLLAERKVMLMMERQRSKEFEQLRRYAEGVHAEHAAAQRRAEQVAASQQRTIEQLQRALTEEREKASEASAEARRRHEAEVSRFRRNEEAQQDEAARQHARLRADYDALQTEHQALHGLLVQVQAAQERERENFEANTKSWEERIVALRTQLRSEGDAARTREQQQRLEIEDLERELLALRKHSAAQTREAADVLGRLREALAEVAAESEATTAELERLEGSHEAIRGFAQEARDAADSATHALEADAEELRAENAGFRRKLAENRAAITPALGGLGGLGGAALEAEVHRLQEEAQRVWHSAKAEKQQLADEFSDKFAALEAENTSVTAARRAAEAEAAGARQQLQEANRINRELQERNIALAERLRAAASEGAGQLEERLGSEEAEFLRSRVAQLEADAKKQQGLAALHEQRAARAEGQSETAAERLKEITEAKDALQKQLEETAERALARERELLTAKEELEEQLLQANSLASLLRHQKAQLLERSSLDPSFPPIPGQEFLSASALGMGSFLHAAPAQGGRAGARGGRGE